MNSIKRPLLKAAVLGLMMLANLVVVGSYTCSTNHQKEGTSPVPYTVSSPAITPLPENIKPAPSLTLPSPDAKDLTIPSTSPSPGPIPTPTPIPQTTPPLSFTTDISFKSNAEKGKTLFSSIGCIGCHTVQGTGGNVGPDLTEVGKRRDISYIEQSILEPKAYIMPGYPPVMPSAQELGLSKQDIADLAAYLSSLK